MCKFILDFLLNSLVELQSFSALAKKLIGHSKECKVKVYNRFNLY